MEAFDMARKLALAGRLSSVPFSASPIYITSQIAAPELSSLRVFVPREHWTRDGVMDVAREIAAILGPTEQFDIGIALEASSSRGPGASETGEPARVTKIARDSDVVVLRMEGEAWRATYPRLDFERIPFDAWRAQVDPGIGTMADFGEGVGAV